MSTQLLVGGRIYSPTNPDATTMAVSNGTIVWLGEERPGRALHPDAEIIDLEGAFVTPAFVDPHVHVTAAGLQLTSLDLLGCASRDELIERLRAHAATHPGEVIWATGWDETTWDCQQPPTTNDLDAAAPGLAVYAVRIDAHSAAASTALREATAGLTGAAGFAPEGPLTAEAHHLVRHRASELLSPAQRAAARTAVLDLAASRGVVCVHECGGPDISGLDDFLDLLGTEHGVQVRGYWGQAVATAAEATDLLAATGAHSLGGDLFADGAIGSRTAWLTNPYAEPVAGCQHAYGRTYLDADTMAAHLIACTEAGIQSGFHVIGDAAVTAAIDALERAEHQCGVRAVAACGHRLEHVEMITREQAGVLARLGVIASMQPVFDALWGGPDGMYAQRLGADRAATLNPFAMLAATGVSLAFGSDSPVTPIDPWPMIRAAVHHRTPGSGISPRAAFSAATRGAWRAGGVRDGIAGTLVPGAPASYAVWEAGELVISAPSNAVQRWSTDPRSRVPPLPDLEAPLPVCLRTVRDGVTIYERGQ
ncbi:amidohydrolase [Lolliginicoccus suaedae]|uniref:amidohydrolase n=1 Tax=Lolliginicoccus suaedae TaxID=2605429 RepID=UPI001F36AE13|nr:amidohydrolase [Lolliginicoccus suaedae]